MREMTSHGGTAQAMREMSAAELIREMGAAHEALPAGGRKDALGHAVEAATSAARGAEECVLQICIEEEELPEPAAEKAYFAVGYATEASRWAAGRATTLGSGNPRGMRTRFARTMRGVPELLEASVHFEFRRLGGRYATLECIERRQIASAATAWFRSDDPEERECVRQFVEELARKHSEGIQPEDKKVDVGTTSG